MRRRWRGILAGVSFAIVAIVAAVCLRSMFAEDSIWRTYSVGEPLTPEALEFARQHGGFDAKLIGRTDAVGIGWIDGKVGVWLQHRRDVMSRWDEEFEREYVNRARWGYRSRARSEARGTWQLNGFWGRLGFLHEFTVARGSFDVTARRVVFPIWPIALVAAIWPVIWLRRFRRERHRRRGGLCMGCGYDLRGNAEARCPECGMLPAEGSTIEMATTTAG